MNLEKETIKQEEKVVRTRKNITDNTDKEQEEEIEFKRRIPKQYWYNNLKLELRLQLRQRLEEV